MSAARPGTCDRKDHTRYAVVAGAPVPSATPTGEDGQTPGSTGMPWTAIALDGCAVDVESRALVGSQALRDALERTLRDHPVTPAS